MIFRVWDIKKNAMYYHGDEHSSFFIGGDSHDLLTSLFTYVADSVGTPLFEYDIVSVAFSEKPNFVSYTPMRFEAVVLLDKDSEFVFLTDDKQCPVIRLNVIDEVLSYMRILGNQFQNPKLYDKFAKMYPRILK